MNTLNRIISSIVLLALFSFDGVAAFGQNSATDSAMIKRNEQMRENHIYLLVSGSRILWTQKGEVKDFSKSKLYINGNPADFNDFKALKDNRVPDCYVNEDNGGKSIIVNTMGHGAKVYLDGTLHISYSIMILNYINSVSMSMDNKLPAFSLRDLKETLRRFLRI
jgi:hypothetical protein